MEHSINFSLSLIGKRLKIVIQVVKSSLVREVIGFETVE